MTVPGDTTVASKISSMDAKPVRALQGVGTARRQDQTPAKQAAAAGDDVQLTGTSRSLAAIEQSLMALPAIDEARVSAVRRRIDSGEYRVDAQRVADRLLHLESDLGRRSPVDGSTLR
jgi:negative regulator of flagellin synthesis FlgM